MSIGSRSAGTSSRRTPRAPEPYDERVAPAWRRLADLWLQREALAARVRRGGPIELSAGLPRGAEVDELVARLLLADAPAGADTTVDDRRRRLADIVAAFDGPLAAAHADLAAELAGDSTFAILAANAGLDPAGAAVFGLLCAIEVDPVLQRLVGWLHDNPSARRASLGLLGRILPADRLAADRAAADHFAADHLAVDHFAVDHLAAVAPDGPLLRAGYVTVDEEGPWSARPVVVEAGVIWALLGDRSQDPDLPADLDLHLSAEPGDPRARLVVVHGGDRWRRRQAGTDRAAAARWLVTSPPAEGPTGAGAQSGHDHPGAGPAVGTTAGPAAGWRALVREATIRGCGVVLELDGPLGPVARRWVERAGHLTWVLSSAAQLPLDGLPRRGWLELEAGDDPADPEDWARLLPGAEPGRHPLSAHQIRQVARAYDAVGGDLDAAVRRLASGAIDRLARRIRPRRTWNDLVLPEGRRAELGEVVARYRHRARVHGEWGYRLGRSEGVVALFHGPSGTGKTLSAEIIAHDLGLDLFVIDLSAMVSKYIGETEKNLEEVFNAASAANVVLLFDEADSLFGKRSEVNEAKDRYANIEVSYLLQRIEAYDGIAILTTNLAKNIDQAFLRRIHVLVEYDLPEVDERLALWRLGFPPGAPLGPDVDLEALAGQFKLAGGNIHSVTLGAGFLAAEAGTPITMAHVVAALGREYAKLGRLRTAEEFGPWLTSG